MHPDLDLDGIFENRELMDVLETMLDMDIEPYVSTSKLAKKAKKHGKPTFSDLFSDLMMSMEDETDEDFDIELDDDEPLVSAPTTLSPEEKLMNTIKELKDNKEDIMSLIEKMFEDGVKDDLMYLLQEKLSLYFGYDETSSIDIPAEVDKEAILLNIIELFNSIDFKSDTLSNKLKINMLKSLINEYNTLKMA